MLNKLILMIIGSGLVLSAQIGPQGAPVFRQIYPAAGSGSGPLTFQVQAQDTQASPNAANLTSIELVFATTSGYVDSPNCHVTYYMYYNVMGVYDASGNIRWMTPGSGDSQNGGNCTLSTTGAHFTNEGGGIGSAYFPITFSSASFTGSHYPYVWVNAQNGQSSGYVHQNGSVWTVPAGGGLPNVSLVSPSYGGTGSSATFEIDATGADQGWTSLQISPSGWSVPNSCILQYQTNGTVCLGTNAFDGSGGGYFVGCTAVGPGGSTLSNAQCSMNAANGQISVSGTTRKYIMPITFTPAYTGAKNVLGLSSTSGGAYGTPVTFGSWTVPVASTNGSLLSLESSGPTLLVPYVRFSLPDGSDPYVWDVATKGENYVMTVRDAAPNSQVWARQMFAGIGREANGDRDDIFFKPTLGPSGDNYYAFNATSDPDSVLNNIGWLVGVTDANGYFSGTFTAGPYGANGVAVYVGNSAGSPGPANADGSQSHSTFLVDSNYVGGFVFWLQHNGTPAAPNIQ